MIHKTVRRFTLALVLGVSSLAAVDVAGAQSVTGTDPMPPSCGCGKKPGQASVTAPPSSTTASSASTSTVEVVTQAVLLFLGLS